MGEGTVNLLNFLVHLLTANGKVFLIEEMENDIHPKVLKLLLELIVEKSRTNQFIISTHNNIVVKYAGVALDSKLFSMTMTPENGVPTSAVDEVPNTPESRMKVLEDLGYDVFDFELWKAYLILEESSAESVINKILIPFFVPSLTLKLRTISANGNENVEARVKDFLGLFLFIHTSPQYKRRAWVAIDGDGRGKSIIETLAEKYTNWPKEHFRTFKESNFERYFPPRFQNNVTNIFTLQNPAQRREGKSQLLHDVLIWVQKNPDEAKIEFEQSASEVISFLKEIEKQIAQHG